uniref:U10-agatoxin-Ao1a n=1 Tax=Agelena orientalis TaxID=293813 RepID=TXAG1_AGEOR|nr:RecName: Full=U10-agatoxin-Ao1a; Short=U10-AGTX-Ao1a; AltName: Full=AgorTX_B7b; Flags: Precursor [Agelena orientalis]AAU93684.1 toxin-like structure AgorTX_B7b precursor [Agelena orientalis]
MCVATCLCTFAYVLAKSDEGENLISKVEETQRGCIEIGGDCDGYLDKSYCQCCRNNGFCSCYKVPEWFGYKVGCKCSVDWNFVGWCRLKQFCPGGSQNPSLCKDPNPRRRRHGK